MTKSAGVQNLRHGPIYQAGEGLDVGAAVVAVVQVVGMLPHIADHQRHQIGGKRILVAGNTRNQQAPAQGVQPQHPPNRCPVWLG